MGEMGEIWGRELVEDCAKQAFPLLENTFFQQVEEKTVKEACGIPRWMK